MSGDEPYPRDERAVATVVERCSWARSLSQQCRWGPREFTDEVVMFSAADYLAPVFVIRVESVLESASALIETSSGTRAWVHVSYLDDVLKSSR